MKKGEYVDDLEQFEDQDENMDNDFPDVDDNKEAQSKAIQDDFQNLVDSKFHLPDTHAQRSLRACRDCRLVKSESQWRADKYHCQNCNAMATITNNFTGLVSIFLPSSSWVARWNNLEGSKPGIYAITLQEGYDDQEQRPQKQKQSRQRRNDGYEDDDWSDEEDYNK